MLPCFSQVVSTGSSLLNAYNLREGWILGRDNKSGGIGEGRQSGHPHQGADVSVVGLIRLGREGRLLWLDGWGRSWRRGLHWCFILGFASRRFLRSLLRVVVTCAVSSGTAAGPHLAARFRGQNRPLGTCKGLPRRRRDFAHASSPLGHRGPSWGGPS